MTELRPGPVFIVGCPRSGTTLVQQLLDAHPDVAIAPETFFMRRFWKKRNHYGDLADPGRLTHLIDDLVQTPEYREMALPDEDLRRAASAGVRDHAGLFRLLLELYGRSRGALLVGEKTPDHVRHMRDLEGFFPEARFVHIIRDPRAVVCSWRQVPWSRGSIARDAEAWRKHLSGARRRPPRGAGKLLEIRFEALVRDPEGCLRPLCRFLEIDFSPRMLRHHEHRNPGLNLAREPWKGDAVKPVSVDSLDKWRSQLDAAEVREIEAVTFREMRRVGYRRDHRLSQLAVAVPFAWFRRLGWRVTRSRRRAARA